jgi:hypothetical protein
MFQVYKLLVADKGDCYSIRTGDTLDVCGDEPAIVALASTNPLYTQELYFCCNNVMHCPSAKHWTGWQP